ncbi:MAG: sigma-70 family RNA polymerase sigma factor [Chitinophagaceae bacterium]|nr:sigma-70 family RNA polymerase sigma factor [Chitinophagaceae bacterium]
MNTHRENYKTQIEISGNTEISDISHRLFQLISKGDKGAFHQLFNLYAPFSVAIIKKIIGPGEPVEDILQEVFLKLWLKKETLPSVENPKAWIARITCYICYNWLRHEKYGEKATAQIRHLLPDSCNHVEEAIAFTETTDNLAKAVKELPPQTRLIFKLSKEQGMKISEIASYMQLSPQTVKNTLGTALKKVKAYLRQHGLTS